MEIRDLHVLAVYAAEDIVGLEVSVAHVVIVKVLYSFEDLFENFSCIKFFSSIEKRIDSAYLNSDQGY